MMTTPITITPSRERGITSYWFTQGNAAPLEILPGHPDYAALATAWHAITRGHLPVQVELSGNWLEVARAADSQQLHYTPIPTGRQVFVLFDALFSDASFALAPKRHVR